MSTNVLFDDFLMASSFFHRCSGEFADNHQVEWDDKTTKRELSLRLVFAFACLMSALCFAPERPVEFASICEKHNSVHACRVW